MGSSVFDWFQMYAWALGMHTLLHHPICGELIIAKDCVATWSTRRGHRDISPQMCQTISVCLVVRDKI
jgi:hypothetical protein